ncbi:MAG TPA: protein translocase subunit SecF [Polyangia bacterium]|nr:protein translocase subunit SecF [Polyangia bacterium]
MIQIIKSGTNFDFMGKRRAFITLSLVVVLASLVAMFAIGPKFGIDFMGGTEIQIDFEQTVGTGEIRATMDKLGFPGAEVVSFGAHASEYLIRLQAISPVSDEQAVKAQAAIGQALGDNAINRFELSQGGDKLSMRLARQVEIPDLERAVAAAGLVLGSAEQQVQAPSKSEDEPAVEESSKRCESVTCTWPFQDTQIYEVNLKGVADRVMDGLRQEPWGAGAVKMRSEWVGPKVGQQLRVAGVSSIVYALLFIMLYVAVRFDLRFAPGGVVALIHDVIITMGIFTLARVEVTLATIAALLTIIGYSLNDTIVVFDRIRENLGRVRERSLVAVINQSVNETLSRTLLTSLTTLLVVAVLLIVGWKTTIRDFAFALLVGVLVGTYSTIFIASPIVVWIDKRMGKKKA